MRTRTRPGAVRRTKLRTHPAVMAWVAVTGRGRAPDSLALLGESVVPPVVTYRLGGVGEGGGAVVARRAPADVILLERTIYERVLPQVPVTAPRYYGSCLDGAAGWLFIEDVGEARCSPAVPDHLALAGRWVATLHVAAARLGGPDGLPESGPPRYLRHLRAARAKIHACLGRWHLASSEIEVLVALLALSDVIESRWAHIEAGCLGAPATLVHGHFRPERAALRIDRDGVPSLLPMHWERAGWGPPSVDLTRIDVAAYWNVVHDDWPGVDLSTVRRLAATGRVLEAIAAADWACESLQLEHVESRSTTVADLAVLLEQLEQAATAAHLLA